MRTDSLEPQEQSLELILPCEDSFYGAESFFENLKLEHRLAATFGFLPVSLVGLNIGFHASIEDLSAIWATVIDSI